MFSYTIWMEFLLSLSWVHANEAVSRSDVPSDLQLYNYNFFKINIGSPGAKFRGTKFDGTENDRSTSGGREARESSLSHIAQSPFFAYL